MLVLSSLAAVEAVAAQLEEGETTVAYVVIATAPGIYVAPPASAEEMYEPATFGRSAADILVVE